MYNLLISQETASLLIEYAVYGGIFIVGLIVLLFMKRASRKPVVVLAISKNERTIEEVEKLLNKLSSHANKYALSAHILQVSSDVGDLLVLADKEFTQNKNIAYETVLAYYQNASRMIDGVTSVWDMSNLEQTLSDIKGELTKALGVLQEIKTGKK